jgi:hypothetical protein
MSLRAGVVFGFNPRRMANTFAVSRAQLVYVLCLPLAVVLGYLLADPMDLGTIGITAAVLGLLATPIFIRWYHPLLILGWNVAIQPAFLPGQPLLWMLLAMAGITFALLNRFVNPEARFIPIPSLAKPLLFLLGAVIFTSWVRGGIGLRVLGSSSYGSKSYFWLFSAIAGFFAMTSQRIPKERAALFTGIYFLLGSTALVANLAQFGGSSTDFLLNIFSPTFAGEQFNIDPLTTEVVRIGGLTAACIALECWLLARFGIRELFDWTRPWRLLLLALAAAGALFCGYRNVLILFVVIFTVQFYFERLCTPRILIAGVSVVLLSGLLIIPNVDKLPMVAQRTLSFLPIPLSPTAKLIGERSTDWRLDVWKDALPDIPPHLFVGKGYGVDPVELAFSYQNSTRHYMSTSEWVLVAGNFHNGPLSVIIPLGIWGVIGFGWFVAASLRYLYRTYRFGDPSLRRINTLLLSFFIGKVLLFLIVFGAFASELYVFTGLMGLSVALNGSQPSPVPAETEAAEAEELIYNERLVTE